MNNTKAMGVNIQDISKFKGHLCTLDRKQVIEVEEIVFSSDSLKTINTVTERERVQNENQKIFVNSITINKDQKEAFTRGQNNLKKSEDGKRLTMPQEWSPIHFYANLEAVILKEADSINCQIELGSISFDLQNALPDIDGDYATYQNVNAMLHPIGNYNCVCTRMKDSDNDESI